jgi:hypothetical protein
MNENLPLALAREKTGTTERRIELLKVQLKKLNDLVLFL